MHVFRLLGVHCLGEEIQNLGESFPVPQRAGTIHGRGKHVSGGLVGLTGSMKSSADLLQNGIHTMRDGRWTLGTGSGDEVRDAGDDADVGLGPNGLQGRSEDLHPATPDDLTSLHKGTGAARVFVHMTTHVRIPQEGEPIGRGHLDELLFRKTNFLKIFQSINFLTF